ncbi:retrovirus-related Pol polyprotein from transposon 297 [Trichonephila clavipes]|nr:retrovirus-related Pol polyprotein from transposon 297 [Trichonephila clavipes]
MVKFIKEHDVTFTNKRISFMMTDGIRQTIMALSTVVDLYIEGKVIPTEFLVLPDAKGNKTLLGLDFLNAAGIVLDVQGGKWHFSGNPRKQYKFFKKTLEDITLSAFELRKDEDKNLSPEQTIKINILLGRNEACFQPGGEPTPYIEHRIDTGDHAPIATSPFIMNPVKKEVLRKQIEELLRQDVIEECESPYAAPVVLVPKPNGKVRLCVDYRKLNLVSKVDAYPLPRMDDLLNEATPTSFMSTIDLQSGYHQVKVADVDQDKTAFFCPFGTCRYLRMPFGLQNAPATFQRLIDKFRSGLKDVFALSYLDDIIVLSETFEKHQEDLEKVFERLSIFKLHANRDKCHFACDRVKYLEFWITKDGIEADQDKISAIQKIPVPTNVKEVQSLLQTCSWFRLYVPNFTDLAGPLSSLTKKKVQWHWGPEQQESFETLKMRLMTPPILKQADGSKPFTIRTDASSYDWEQSFSKEVAPMNMSSKKFRGYVENQQIFLASDHQPFKWLLSIKSPSGRLARWALKIQSFNLKIDYTPAKANVVADMLSRPSYTEGAASDVCAITVDMPSRKSSDILKGQLEDEELKKIFDCFEKDTSTKWVELFALAEATAENCAKTLIEVLLRYGLPRRLISDNGPQFISAVMQLTCDLLEITQDLIPVYHPQANPSELSLDYSNSPTPPAFIVFPFFPCQSRSSTVQKSFFSALLKFPSSDEADEDEDNNESNKGPSNADAFTALETAMEWYEQQSDYSTVSQSTILLNYCCSRESETLQRKHESVQCYSEKISDYFPQ